MSEYLPADQNERVSGTRLEVLLSAVDDCDTIAGNPQQGFTELATLGLCDIGVWELRAGTVKDTEVDEVFVVLSGNAIIEFVSENRSVEVSAGDVMRLVAGTQTRWIVPDHIRKVYIAPQG